MAGFKQTLESLGLGDYEEIFVSEGFDTWETLADVTESDLYGSVFQEHKHAFGRLLVPRNELGVKLGHRRVGTVFLSYQILHTKNIILWFAGLVC